MTTRNHAAWKVFLIAGYVMAFSLLSLWLKANWLPGLANPDLVMAALYGLPALIMIVAWRQERYTESSYWRVLALALVFISVVSLGRAFDQFHILLTLLIPIVVMWGIYLVVGKDFFNSIWDDPAGQGEPQSEMGS